MSSPQIDVDPNITIITPDSALPLPPVISQIGQITTNVICVIYPPTVTTAAAIGQILLYRAPTPHGPWTLVDQRTISDISRKNNLFDTDPLFGITSYYGATVIDTVGNASTLSVLQQISPAASSGS
jgi:hypothetical protein